MESITPSASASCSAEPALKGNQKSMRTVFSPHTVKKGHVVVRRAVLVCVEISKPQDGVFRVRIRLRAQNFRAVLNETVGKSIRKSVQLAVFDDGGKAVMTVRIGAQRKMQYAASEAPIK